MRCWLGFLLVIFLASAQRPAEPLPLTPTGEHVTATANGKQLSFAVINSSQKQIVGWAIVVDVVVGGKVVTAFTEVAIKEPGMSVRPGEVVPVRPFAYQPRGGFDADFKIKIDYVRFADHSSWGPDSRKDSRRIAGFFEGFDAARKRLKRLLSEKGVGAVVDELKR